MEMRGIKKVSDISDILKSANNRNSDVFHNFIIFSDSYRIPRLLRNGNIYLCSGDLHFNSQLSFEIRSRSVNDAYTEVSCESHSATLIELITSINKLFTVSRNNILHPVLASVRCIDDTALSAIDPFDCSIQLVFDDAIEGKIRSLMGCLCPGGSR